MRPLPLAALLATLPLAAAAAPTWQTISSEPGKRIELDRTSLKREGNSVQAQGRVVLEKELIDGQSGAGYRVIEAVTRYDCGSRNASTIRRVYKKNETEVVREEDVKGVELPVRSGTLDDKVLREVCRPPKEDAAELARKAGEAGAQLKTANEAMLPKEGVKSGMIKASDPAHESKPEPAKAAGEGGKAAARSSVYYVNNPQGAAPAKAKKAAKAEGGYMLELAAAQQQAHIHWDYDGAGAPENWASLDPKNKVCATGQRQSPIDIRDGIKVDIEPIRFDYRPSTFRIVDNGHTVQVSVGDSAITLTGKSYELVQFHFHRPSEEKINGQRFDMVAHLVHKADDGQLAVVAVLMERGTENPFIQMLWNHLPLEKNRPVSPPTAVIDPAQLLPAGRNYYTYMGSLTTPPCTEDVLWLVMKQPVQVSTEQINIFSRLYRNNARPIQPTAGRLIKEGR